MSTKQELFTKVTGLTFDVSKVDDSKLAWLIPDGKMLDGEGKKTELTKEFMAEANIDIAEKFEQKEPVEVESTAFIYIHDAASWGESYASGAVKAYYEKYPDEDWWNESAGRAANFNDKAYVVNIYDSVECEGDPDVATLNAQWISSTVQKIYNNDEAYYLDIFYSLDDNAHELFTDDKLTESTGKFAKFISVSFPTCVHCWDGVVNAPGAKLPWIAPYFTEDVNAKIRFEYEGKEPVYPWGDKVFGVGSWGIASVASEFGDDSFALTVNGGEETFDISKFKMILVK
jgi:hypothetical protein